MKDIPLANDILGSLIHENRLFHGVPTEHYRKQWTLRALSGSLIELSGKGATACLTWSSRLIVDAQLQNELVAWIVDEDDSFFPPDLGEAGVDLEALAVIRLKDDRSLFRAGEQLLKSSAFGLVIMDLHSKPWMPHPIQIRLAALAKKSNAVLLCLTRKAPTTPSMGPLFSLRGCAGRKRIGKDRFSCELRILKDKRRGPGWMHREICYGHDGLR